MAYEITRRKERVVYEEGGDRLINAMGTFAMDEKTKLLLALAVIGGLGFWLVNSAYKEKEELLHQQLMEMR
jgi:hypothetical protein